MTITNKRILKVIQNQIGQEEPIKLEDNLEELGIDSLDEVEIVMALDEEFFIDIPDSSIDKWNTVQDIVNTVRERIPNAS